MRIIAGEFRGRRLFPPRGMDTRPITDRAKQSLFDILAPMIPGARVYDLFAGTGSMGIEALSRGAEHVTFFESGSSAINGLEANIAILRLDSRSRLIRKDLFRWFAQAETPTQPIDLVFLDPPYRFLRDQPEALRELAQNLARHLADDVIVVFRHDARDNVELPSLVRYDQRQYGGMSIEFLRPAPR